MRFLYLVDIYFGFCQFAGRLDLVCQINQCEVDVYCVWYYVIDYVIVVGVDVVVHVGDLFDGLWSILWVVVEVLDGFYCLYVVGILVIVIVGNYFML